MDDDDDVKFQVPEPGRWVSYQWVVSTTSHDSVFCWEGTGRFSIKNVGTSDCGRWWCETEFVHDRSTSSENLIFKLLIDPQYPSDQRIISPTGWLRFNEEPAKPFKTFSPNHYPDLCRLIQQVCGYVLRPLRGAIDRHESLGLKAISHSHGQLECMGTSTVAVKDWPFASDRTIREKTDRTIWLNAAVPFFAVAESHVIVNQRLLVESGNPEESGWTSALHLSDFGSEATSRLIL